jgi:hypothetical protein
VLTVILVRFLFYLGAEKVMALEGCILMAKKWYQALPENKVGIHLLSRTKKHIRNKLNIYLSWEFI